MTALAALLDDDQAAALARLQHELATAPSPPAELVTAVCPACGQARPVPAALFREAAGARP
jgi:hypothetical protein